jgi:hypothetical protein
LQNIFQPVLAGALTEMMNRKVKHIRNFNLLVAFSCTLAIAACKKNGCITQPGAIAKKKLELPLYQTIILYNNINLFLTQDTVAFAEFEAGENILPFLYAEVENKSLIVKNNAKCEWIAKPGISINLYLHVTNLDQVVYNGSGNISSTNRLKANTFYLTSKEGSGNVKLNIETNIIYTNIDRYNASFVLNGSSRYLSGFCDTKGSFDFGNFRVNTMDLWYAGAGDAKIYVLDTIRTVIYQNGNVFLKGNPAFVQKEYRGKGKLINY